MELVSGRDLDRSFAGHEFGSEYALHPEPEPGCAVYVSTVLAHFVEKLSGNELQMLASKKSGILDRLNLGSGLAFCGSGQSETLQRVAQQRQLA